MKTILVVDDLAVFREPLELLLKGQGFRVLAAGDGEQALEVLEHELPHLILLDLGMPVLDGIEVLRQVRQSERLREIPVLVLSAAADRTRVSMAAKLGIAGYVLKSRMSMQQVVEKVRQIVGPDRADVAAPPPATALVSDLGVEVSGSTSHSMVGASGRGCGHEPIGVCRFDAPDLSRIQPLMTRGELLSSLSRCEGLQGFSPAATLVASTIAGERCSLEELGRVVRLDPVLSLRVLRLANTQAYARSERIDSVARAVKRLGLEQVREVVASAGQPWRLIPERVEPYIHAGLFWEHSVACGLIASELAAGSGVHDAQVAFTCGLLHDVGRLACAQLLGEAYVAVLHAAQHAGALVEQVEARMLLLNHAEVADRILQNWKLPRQIVEPVLYHHISPAVVRGVTPLHAEMTLRVGLADRLAHAMMLGHSGNAAIYPIEEHCHLLGVQTVELERVCTAVAFQIDQLRKDLGTSRWEPWSTTVAQRIDSTFNPAYFSIEPEVDGYGLFCRRLRGDTVPGRATHAVVHLAHENDGAMLRGQLEAWRAEPANAQLPVVLLLGHESGGVPDYLVGRQPLATIAAPFAVSRFIEAVQLLAAGGQSRQAA